MFGVGTRFVGVMFIGKNVFVEVEVMLVVV